MESRSQESGNSFGVQGRYTYADYSPLEDDRNLVEVIKEFAALSARLGRLDVTNRKLLALASDSDRLRQDIISAIKNIKSNTNQTMEKFHDEHADVLSNELLTKGSTLLLETKNSLSELLSNTESGFDEQHGKYREKISAKIGENNAAALSLVDSWLASDFMNLPRPILLHLSVSVSASLDRKTNKGYELSRRCASATDDDAQGTPDALQFAYSFRIDPTEVEFWNFRRNVTDLGIKELMLPVGMKAPVSEKIKQTFRFGSRKDAEVMKEPEFVKADNYVLVQTSLQGDKTLTIELARDPARVQQEGDIFRITYDVGALSSPPQSAGASAPPKIDYLSSTGTTMETESDLLQIADIRSIADLSKIHLLGAAVLARIRMLQDPQLLRSRGKIAELRTAGSRVIVPADLGSGQYSSMFEFLQSIARSYAPFVKKMQTKTSMTGELILREELGGGQRKEYSVRANDLRSQLAETESGRAIAIALGL